MTPDEVKFLSRCRVYPLSTEEPYFRFGYLASVCKFAAGEIRRAQELLTEQSYGVITAIYILDRAASELEEAEAKSLARYREQL